MSDDPGQGPDKEARYIVEWNRALWAQFDNDPEKLKAYLLSLGVPQKVFECP